MDFNERLEKALASARDLQRTVGEALSKANDQFQPLLQESVRHAQDLHSTLSKHAVESGAIAQQQTQVAMGHVNDYIKVGSEALRQSADQARDAAQKMAEQAKKVVDSTTAAMSKPPDGGGGRPPNSPG
jgi:phage-related minor tail protein